MIHGLQFAPDRSTLLTVTDTSVVVWDLAARP
jgi:hypothetical protein